MAPVSEQALSPAAPPSPLSFAPVLLVLVGAVVYLNSLWASFILDDQAQIVNNPAIHSIKTPLRELFRGGSRALCELTFAINYQWGGLDPRGYHVVNAVIHILAALVLYGLVRRTLLLPYFRERFGGAAAGLALAVSLLWLVHPLQTASVTYATQRQESLMGLFYLLTFYCLLRGASPGAAEQEPPARQWPWYIGTLVCYFLGMRTKEVMVTAPVLLLLYDYLFLAPSLGQLVRRRWGFYAVLAVLAVYLTLPLVLSALPRSAAEGAKADRSAGAGSVLQEETAGFGQKNLTPLDYARSQPEVIVHYLRLAVWPDSLCLHYAWPITRDWSAAAPYLVVIGLLLLATLWALWRRPGLGFLGAWFFLILAPTSSILPIEDLTFDHRMYLSLAAVIALVVIGGYALLPRASAAVSLAAGLVGMVAVVLGLLTVLRNADYHDVVWMWSDVVAKRPADVLGWENLSYALLMRGDFHQRKGRAEDAGRDYAEAIRGYQKALSIDPDSELAHNPLRAYPVCHNSLGVMLLKQGKTSEALKEYSLSIELAPNYSSVHNNLGMALYKQACAELRKEKTEAARDQFRQDLEKAVKSLRRAVELQSDPIRKSLFRFNLATVLNEQGKESEARQEYQQALRNAPGWPEIARTKAGEMAAFAQPFPGDGPEAVFLAKQACQAFQVARANRALPWATLAAAYALDRDYDGAVSAAKTALELAVSPKDKALRDQVEKALEEYRKKQAVRR
jgi:tetratricopeptide (TPR) repeat protein